MLIVNLLNGMFLASLVCFIVGAVLLAISVGRNASQPANYRARISKAFADPGFRTGRTLIVAGGVVAVASLVAIIVLSATLPRCANATAKGSAISMCMPAPQTTTV